MSMGSDNVEKKTSSKITFVFNSLKQFHACQRGLPPCLGHELFKHFTFVQLNRWIAQLKFKDSLPLCA